MTGLQLTVDEVRRIAEGMLEWCRDERAEMQVLGSILIPITSAVRARVAGEIAAAIEAERSATTDDLIGKTWNTAIVSAAAIARLAGGVPVRARITDQPTECAGDECLASFAGAAPEGWEFWPDGGAGCGDSWTCPSCSTFYQPSGQDSQR